MRDESDGLRSNSYKCTEQKAYSDDGVLICDEATRTSAQSRRCLRCRHLHNEKEATRTSAQSRSSPESIAPMCSWEATRTSAQSRRMLYDLSPISSPEATRTSAQSRRMVSRHFAILKKKQLVQVHRAEG